MGEKRTGGGMNAGFLFLYDWLPGFAALPATDLKQLFLALIARQRDGVPLPTFKRATTEALAQIIEVTIKRRLGGRDGGEKNDTEASAEGVPLTPTLTSGQGRGTAKHSKAKHSKEKQSIVQHSIITGGRDPDGSPDTDSRPLPESETVGRETEARRSPSGNSSATPEFGYDADDDDAAHSPPCHSERSEESRREISVCRPSRSFASLEDDTKDGIGSEAREAGARRSPSGNTSATPEFGYGDDEAARGRWFEEFWETYPKKMGIDEAEAAFETAVLDRASFDRVMDGLSAWCASEEWQEQGGRFVPRAAVFLRDRRFLMPPTTRDRGGGKQSTADRAHGGERKRAQSFDIDDFFAAALRRSYGEDAVV